MKLAAILLLSLTALAWADTSYQNYNSYNDQADSSNYYQHQPVRRNGRGLAGIIRRFLSPIRRQGVADLIPANVGVFVAAAVVVAVAVVGVTVAAATFNNSGRGLDTDEWEVDHSVWMDQLQRDFEDSWSAE